jgi:anti-sigma-K factor RskA
MNSARPTPTIALVAIPGAGDHAPGAAARAVADLLLRLRSCAGTRYGSFVEHPVRIPTKPTRVNPRSAPNVAPDLRRSIFAEQHAFLRTQLQYGGAAARDREEDSPDHQLMRAQLAEYHSSGAPYDTVRLEGERLIESADGAAREIQARLHVYEVRWAELSRLKSGATRYFAELYQLFFHVAHLGRIALDHARLEHPGKALWRLYGAAHTWTVRLLTLFLPAVFVAMLTTMLAAALPRLASSGGLPAARLILGLWLVAAGGLIFLAFRAYERLRPGALIVGVAAYVIATTPVALLAPRARREDDLLDGTMQVFELQAALVWGVWDVAHLVGLLAGLVGLVACARTDGAAGGRAWRTARTAAATLAVVATSVVVATFLLWTAMTRAVAGLLPTRPYVALLPIFDRDAESYGAFLEHVLELSAGAGVPLLLIVTSALAVLGALALLPALIKEVRPPHSGDRFDERANGTAAPRSDAPVDTDVLWAAWERLRREGDRSQRQGRWITRGFWVAGAAVVLLYVAVFVVSPAASYVGRLTAAPALTRLSTSASTIILVAGGWLAAAAIALVALRGRFSRLTLGFRAALDVALEVDNYLRTHPRDATPRARIAERYVSLLRYLCHWRDRGGRPYDAIVLVAHSQGAAITADLLGFVQREEDAELEPIRRPLANGAPGAAGRRLYLFTMGSPLRQLYSEWFPHLFGWVRGERGDGVSRPLPAVPREPWMLLPRLEDGHRVHAPPIPDGAAPDPYAMGVTRWVNAYRSGDYVGRAQWRHAVDECDSIYRSAPIDAATRFVGDTPPIMYVSEDAHRSRRELCIGGGGHTHYWDATAKAIAVELDLLVTDATKIATRVSKDTGAPAEGMES